MPVISSHIQCSFGKIYFEQFGEIIPEKTLVFLHDAIGSVSIMGHFPKLVHEKTGLPVLVFDRLGYGKSDPDPKTRETNYLQYEAETRIPEILASFGISEPILIGHSDGGSIALVYAARHKTRAVFSMAAHIYEEAITRQGIMNFVNQPGFDLIKEKLTQHHGHKTEKILSGWHNTWLTEDYKAWNLESYLPKISCSVFAIQGDKDEYATDQHLLDIKSEIGENCETAFIENCGHVPYKEKREATTEHLINFLEKMSLLDIHS